jgi:uncharacterized protein involved in outer membrane biogenesis
MTIKPSYLKLAGLLLIFGTILFLVIGPLLPRLVDISTYQQQIVTLLEDSLKRKISLGNIRFVWRLGPQFVVTDLHLRERTSDDEFLRAEKVTFRLGLLPLLKRQVALRSIVVDGLQARITRDAAGALNIDDLLKPRAGGVDLQVRGIKLRQARILWQDQATPNGPQRIQLTAIDLKLDHISRGKKGSYKLSATLGNGSIKSAGSIRLPAAGEPFNTGLAAKGTLTLTQIDYSRLWPYYGQHLPFGPPGGTLDLEAQLKGTPSDFTAQGQLRLNNAKVVWSGVFRGPVAPKQAQLQFDLKRTPSSIDLSTIELDADGFSFSGSLKLSDLQSNDPYLSAKGVSKPFEYQQVRSYIPFGIIDDDAADFIEHKIKAGRFRLTNGTLEGRLSKLARFDEGDNPGALFISGTAEQAVINYGAGIPSFSNISCELEMKGRDFNLYRASGSFGGSPFTMQRGSITDYCTVGIPSTYPFQMEISNLKSAEVAWLAQLVGAERLKFSGTAPLQLTGEGPVNAYRLAGDWQLTNAAYAFPDVVNKPAGMANSLSFSSLLDKDKARITALSYSLAPLQLSGLATFRHSGPVPYLSFELQSNSFMLAPQLPILTGWQQFQPKGTLEAHVNGSGDPRDLSAMQYDGTVRLGNFSVRPLENRAPLTAINGLIALKGNSLETSRIAVRYGKTALQLRGRIASLKNPEAELFISSAELQPADFGVNAPSLPPIRAFSANLGFRKGLYTIRNLSGKLPKTAFSLAGTIRPEPVPDLNLRMAVNHLAIDELLPLLAPERPAPTPKGTKPSKPAQPFILHGQLNAESGNYGEIVFNKLRTQFTNEGGLLQLDSLQAGVLGGQLSAKGQLERINEQPPRWALQLSLDRIESDRLLQSLGINREISGLMNVKGDLRAQGDRLETLKRTASGTLSLKIERGHLRRFSTLAKTFSLLNVSQLLTFQLPDMVSEGMPFNQITATVGVKDGILSSQDFFINSNAMHLSMVGKINIVKEDLDLLIGVQPLQTVDKVISRIPVVGWILTGGDGSLITTYFEAKGSWADPQVTAIPVKSIASGTLNIFRRVFELPVRVFTDSGEVLLGNQKERPKAGELPSQ